MAGKRVLRINQLLREELSRLVHEEIKDPRVSGVTITHVEASPDLSFARVSVRTLSEEHPVEDAMDGLRSASGFIRHRLGKDLHFRRIPELDFVEDDTLEHVKRIDALLDEARVADAATSDAATSDGATSDGVTSDAATSDAATSDADCPPETSA
ncbi:MAG: 30S ribosome-binding factor RbfA [Gemmatimonadota bacterium]